VVVLVLAAGFPASFDYEDDYEDDINSLDIRNTY
jgi:hypothetical protein